MGKLQLSVRMSKTYMDMGMFPILFGSSVCEDEIELDFRTLLYLCGNVE